MGQRAKNAFHKIGPNFMTPTALGYYEAGKYGVELSTGGGFHGEPIYGVTVYDYEKESSDHELSRMFTSRKEADVYIVKIKQKGRK